MLHNPEVGEVWQHRNGIRYRIVCITNLPDDDRYPMTVVYQNVVNDSLWSRPMGDWHRSFTETS